jgi:hypothetical protein
VADGAGERVGDRVGVSVADSGTVTAARTPAWSDGHTRTDSLPTSARTRSAGAVPTRSTAVERYLRVE